ncbi:sigma-70 family RNA polymerase sigma factor [Streptomyces sp. ET3-23]|uniref:RNA polymerase sigma factor n=1 Tax=Streptomyces sp. ET3-23 TaxID=2885643 RepID=UPI001D0FBE95|nr:sigma-70 family RNA polymerase sigma factor [Streptomyces sp. ET3-23]MCC2276603.1 sigma-70 family RNA polymerase sigma factor [Streptomyces sp. ET3-23]
MPLDYEAYYLGHQEFFHAFAELHLGNRRQAEETVHLVFLEILLNWESLLQQTDLEQRTLAVLGRHVRERLRRERRRPAFVIAGPIARNLRLIRSEMELAPGDSGLYEAILELPARQFTVIVLKYLLGYSTTRIARYMDLDPRTVDYHGRKAKERLRIRLDLPADTSKKKGRGQ